MNNEPVAWMAVNELNGSYSTFTNDQKQKLLPHISQCYSKWIPLYTHPHSEESVKVKELTDEEIMEVATINLGHSMGLLNWMGFARAILRKAQENG
jgi:hypothetical protein